MSNPQSGVFVQFYTDSVEIKVESERMGRPIFKDMPHIRKLVPGDSTTVIERVAKKQDMDMFPRQWEAYQRQETIGLEGTPLEQWPQITRSQVREAKYFELHTVEQLSELSDHSCQKLGMGFLELRAKARAWLKVAEGSAAYTAQAAENQRLKDEMDSLRAQIAELNTIHKNPRGRPRKEVDEDQ